jgi:hypothetical protein
VSRNAHLRHWITVVAVCRSIGIEPESNLMMKVGARVRDLWQAEGHIQQYDLRGKTNGPGSHQFAIYPPTWHPVIADVIRSFAADMAADALAQPDLFA